MFKTDAPNQIISAGDIKELTVTIKAGETISTPIWVGCGTFLGVRMPTGWTTASITFIEAKEDVELYYRVLTDIDGDPVVIATPAANRTHKLDAGLFYGIQWIKLVSSTAQTQDRVIELLMAKV